METKLAFHGNTSGVIVHLKLNIVTMTLAKVARSFQKATKRGQKWGKCVKVGKSGQKWPTPAKNA